VKPLAIVPAFLRTDRDLTLLCDCLRSLRDTEGDRIDVLVVDDRSPNHDLVDVLATTEPMWGFELHRKEANEGYSRAVNVGLRRCLDEGRDAITVNSDVEMMEPGWLDLMLDCDEVEGDGKASVVGGMLLYPNGLIQFAGTYFSLLKRDFDHLYRHSPANLPEANRIRVTPITGALQFIRHEALVEVGLYDENMRMAWEDLDFCLRVLLSGRECVFHPGIRAWHIEGATRGNQTDQIKQWTQQSWGYLAHKYRNINFVKMVPG
jgi:GT2 family glycosyltransferase